MNMILKRFLKKIFLIFFSLNSIQDSIFEKLIYNLVIKWSKYLNEANVSASPRHHRLQCPDQLRVGRGLK